MTIYFSNNPTAHNLALLSVHIMSSLTAPAWNSKHLKPLLAICVGIPLLFGYFAKEQELNQVNYAALFVGQAAAGFIVGWSSLLITAMSCSKNHLRNIGANTVEKEKAHILQCFIAINSMLSIMSVVPFEDLSSQLQR